MFFKATPIAIVCATILSGCASSAYQKHTEEKSASSLKVSAYQADFQATMHDSGARRESAQMVNRPYIAGNSRALDRGASMPESLRRSAAVTLLMSPTPIDLGTAVQQLSKATGLIITATPDALMSPSQFMPRTANGAAAPTSMPRVLLQPQNMPMWKLFDEIARQTQTGWRPTPQGAEFFRVETRVYPLSAIAQVAKTTASLGKTGAGRSESATFDASSQTSFENVNMDALKGIKTTVEAMLTTGGKLTLSADNATLIVTDTVQALSKIDEYIKEQNKALTRRVRLMLEAIDVIDNNASEFGLEWDLIYAATNAAVTTAGAGSLASANAAQLGTSYDTGRWKGSALAVKALNEVGTVINRRSFPLLTTSGRPVTQAIRSTFNYIDQVQATNSSAQYAQAPTVSQKDETVGTFLTLLPTARPDGTIFLSVSLDTTNLRSLVPFTTGSGANAVTVQQKTIDGSGVIQEVPIKSGQSFVIGGMESINTRTQLRRLAPNAPILLGGSNASEHVRTRTVLIVTAVTEDSGGY